MPNTLVNPTWVANEAGEDFINNCTFVNAVDRQYSDEYQQAGAKVGYTVQARLPQRFEAKRGQAAQIQALLNQTTPITLTDQIQVAWEYSSAQETMEIQRVKEYYITPATNVIASACDALAFDSVYRDVFSSVGTPGTPASANSTYLDTLTKLADLGAPMNDLKAVLDIASMTGLVNSNLTLFNPAAQISEQFRKGMFGRNALGVAEWSYDQNRATHTTGTFTASTPLVNGASQTGSSLITDGWASGASSLKKGDVFTIADVNSVNRVNNTGNGRLQQFTVTADVSDSGGAMTITISPSIIATGQLKTVDALPANNAAITVLGATSATNGTLATTTSPQSLVFSRGAFAFVMADLVRPSAGAQSSTVRSKQYGIAIRYVQQYQALTDQNVARLDVLVGGASVRPEFAARVWG